MSKKKDQQEVAKANPFPQQVKEVMQQAGVPLDIGDTYIKPSAVIYRIVRFEFAKDYREGHQERVIYQYAQNESLTKWGEEKNESYQYFIRDIDNGTDVRLTPDYLKLKAHAQAIFRGEETDEAFTTNEYAQTMNNENALIGRGSKDGLIGIQNALEHKKSQAGIVAAFLNKEIEAKKRELEKMTEKLYGALEVFQKQIKKVMRLITTIELYLGVEEELHQIQDGEKAPATTPITFRQQVLFMDEEVGTWEDGGLDFTDIEKFDNWLTTDNNYLKVIPEPKGMLVMRPRRKDKDYGRDSGAWGAAMNDANRHMTYFLVRNGDCLHRIYTEKIIITDRLFPLRKEMAELQAKLEKEHWEDNKEKIENDMYRYKKQAMLMQGLLDRTEIFHPLPLPKISIFKLHETDPEGKYVRFIYDDEMQLPSGRLAFKDWRSLINSKITKGSRVLITRNNELSEYSRRDWTDRLFYYVSDYNAPPPPQTGVYEVEVYPEEKTGKFTPAEIEELKAAGKFISQDAKKSTKSIMVESGGRDDNDNYRSPKYKEVEAYSCRYIQDTLTIMYNPKDTIQYDGGWGGDYNPHERKKRIRWRIYTHDSFLLNYDQLDLDDVNFYIHSRVDRKNYLEMMPILKNIRKWRLEEMAQEQDFAKLVLTVNYGKLDEEILKERIAESIQYWKLKNQWKRPIAKDDTLALRMISKRVLSKNYENLKRLGTEA